MLELLKRITTVLAGRMLARTSQFAVFFILARGLTQAEFGLYGLLTTTVLLASLLGQTGLRQAMAFWIGKRRLTQEKAIGTALILIPALTILPGTVAYQVLRSNLQSYSNFDTILIVYPAIAGALAVMVMQGVLLGLGRTNAFSVSESFSPATLLTCVLIAFASDTITETTMLASVVGAHCFAGLFSIILASKGGKRPSLISSVETSRLIRTGIAHSLNIFLLTLSARVSIYLLDYQMSETEAGQFFAGQRFNDLIIQIAMSAGLVLFSDTVRAEIPREILLRNVRVSGWMLWVLGILGILVSFIAESLTEWLLGGNYGDAGKVFAITAVMIGPASASKILYPTIAGMGQPLRGSITVGIGLVLNLSLAYILIPVHGIAGAAYSLVLSQIFIYLGYVTVLAFTFNVPIRTCLVPSKANRSAQPKLPKAPTRSE